MLKEDRQKVYVRWLQRSSSNSAAEEESYKHAWNVAREAARLLRERYGVDRVRVFGSLVHKGRFYPDSDVDLAVEGLKSCDYWEALTSVIFLDKEVAIDMIDRATCRPEIWDVVEQEGIDL